MLRFISLPPGGWPSIQSRCPISPSSCRGCRQALVQIGVETSPFPLLSSGTNSSLLQEQVRFELGRSLSVPLNLDRSMICPTRNAAKAPERIPRGSSFNFESAKKAKKMPDDFCCQPCNLG